MRKRLGTFEDEWDPEALLVACGFQVLVNAETVVAAGDPLEGEPGDLFLRVAFSEARAGAPGRDERDMIIEQGWSKFTKLLLCVQQELEICGNWHWGNQFDVESLSRVLKIGVLVFCDGLRSGGRECLYNIGSQVESFPYWIALWWIEPLHFRLGQVPYDAGLSYTSCWTQHNLPAQFLQEYRRCNRLAN